MRVCVLFSATTLFFVSAVQANAGDSTITLSYMQQSNSHVYQDLAGFKQITDQFIGSEHFGASTTPYRDAEGIALSYRYEFTDCWGVIGRLSYTGLRRGMQIRRGHDYGPGVPVLVDGRSRSQRWGVMAGPSYRITDNISLYGLAGASVDRLSWHLQVADGANAELGTDLQMSSQEKTHVSMAYAAGIQLNAAGYALDFSYTGVGGVDRSHGFTVGAGFMF